MAAPEAIFFFPEEGDPGGAEAGASPAEAAFSEASLASLTEAAPPDSTEAGGSEETGSGRGGASSSGRREVMGGRLGEQRNASAKGVPPALANNRFARDPSKNKPLFRQRSLLAA